MTHCRYDGRERPRILVGEHGPDCPGEATCRGCVPCPEDHCVVCGIEHLDDAHPLTCITCVANIRADLKEIPKLCSMVRRHAQSANGGRLAAAPIPGGEAMVIMAPGGLAHGRAWYDEQKRDASHKADEHEKDIDTPLLILSTWEDDWRDVLGSPTEDRSTVRRAVKYLDGHLSGMAQKADPPIDELAGDIAALRYHLEEVLGAGERDQPGSPCTHCGTALVRVSSKPRTCKHRRLANDVARLASEPRFDLAALCRAYPTLAYEHASCDQGGLRDSWQCLRCKRRYTDQQYQYAVGSDYILNARSLTARELEWKTGVAASVIRVWGSRGLVKKTGRNMDGLLMYDVEQVEQRIRERPAEVAAAAS